MKRSIVSSGTVGKGEGEMRMLPVRVTVICVVLTLLSGSALAANYDDAGGNWNVGAT